LEEFNQKKGESMNTQGLHQLFIDELKDMYSSEHQIIQSLPKLIQISSSEDLKEALSKHLKETQNQVKRLEKIFSLIDTPASEIRCEAMEGLLKEAEGLTQNKSRSATLDAAIISACQKVEHYEIASYGTLYSFAKQLDLDSEITDLLNETLDEEKAADKKLNKIAEGSLFTSGINKEAAGSGRGRNH
jgi:ferritin-like metal-binding protein YciE